MGYSHIGGGDQFTWSAVLLMAFVVFGTWIMPLFLAVLIILPIWALIWLVRTFVKGWRGEA